ncbi:hypothetical protein BO83DRAFT_405187 [Aspergillus eucalypticola CBS 122712]|uniref:Serine hydrolase domain-containing protein n=1 Tax=Aspergillus eucalypticola (strain CBS 122712 / IBT 29274) TaxID=1448314 RepID=A0A317WGD1_ASPEC|nr:uncharacterized protein BO83DRAFT_405187 [Aspergillus eucalypticola CBS 122712]PWY84327.1 hypothetical protein BO83DRAFT_405187 [Aspergillus eucalypticola CBS 122712]
MTILCLHGGFGSAQNFQVQLDPLTSVYKSVYPNTSFHYVDGGHPATPPPGSQYYFGLPPYYRFIEYDGIGRSSDVLERIRQLPRGATAEDTMRVLVHEHEMMSADCVRQALDRLLGILDEHPEIDGVLGFSEGATAAATLLLEEERLVQEEGRKRRLKYGIFLAGWPPLRIVGDRVTGCLADETEDMIVVPTCHIIGANDPYVDGTMALYGVCDPDTAIMFDHGKGHTIPRDVATLKEAVEAIEETKRRGIEAGEV